MRKHAIAAAILAPLTLTGCGALDLAIGAMQGANTALDMVASAAPKAEEKPTPAVKYPDANCRARNGSEFKTVDRRMCDVIKGAWIGQ